MHKKKKTEKEQTLWNRTKSQVHWGGSQLVHPWCKQSGVCSQQEEVVRRQGALSLLTLLEINTDRVFSHKADRGEQRRWQCNVELAEIVVPQRHVIDLDGQTTCCSMYVASSVLSSTDNMSSVQGIQDHLPPLEQT